MDVPLWAGWRQRLWTCWAELIQRRHFWTLQLAATLAAPLSPSERKYEESALDLSWKKKKGSYRAFHQLTEQFPYWLMSWFFSKPPARSSQSKETWGHVRGKKGKYHILGQLINKYSSKGYPLQKHCGTYKEKTDTDPAFTEFTTVWRNGACLRVRNKMISILGKRNKNHRSSHPRKKKKYFWLRKL